MWKRRLVPDGATETAAIQLQRAKKALAFTRRVREGIIACHVHPRYWTLPKQKLAG
jgi:hypothetical protein